MSSSNAVLGLLLSAALPLAAASQTRPYACPTTQGSEHLTAVDVFDGPPSERADLVPDVSRRSKSGLNAAYAAWNVASIYTAGRHVFLVCKYGAAQQNAVIEVADKVSRCTYRSDPRKLPQLTCK